MSQGNQTQTQGGKSRATFLMSHDKRFLLKAINQAEFQKLTSSLEKKQDPPFFPTAWLQPTACQGEAENLFWYFDKAKIAEPCPLRSTEAGGQVLFEKWPSLLTQVIGLFTVSATKKSQNYKGPYRT